MVLIMVMPFRRGRSLTPVQSIKHVIDAGGGLTATASVVVLGTSVIIRSGAPFTPNELLIGETVNGVFLTVNIIGATGAPVAGPVDWYIAKQRSNQDPNVDFPDPGDTGQSNLRNQIIHEEKGVPGSGDGTPHVFKGVVVIPRGMRRTRQGDQLFVKLKMTTGDTGTFCVKAIYKSFS